MWRTYNEWQTQPINISRIAVEYFLDCQQQSTHWYKGTVISYPRKGYVITYDGCGPKENEILRSLKQGVDKGKIRLL